MVVHTNSSCPSVREWYSVVKSIYAVIWVGSHLHMHTHTHPGFPSPPQGLKSHVQVSPPSKLNQVNSGGLAGSRFLRRSGADLCDSHKQQGFPGFSDPTDTKALVLVSLVLLSLVLVSLVLEAKGIEQSKAHSGNEFLLRCDVSLEPALDAPPAQPVPRQRRGSLT